MEANTVNMTAWVHKEFDIIEEEALTKLQEAWDSSQQKDDFFLCAWMTWSGPTGWALRSACLADMDFRE
jgi:hypothetical protein